MTTEPPPAFDALSMVLFMAFWFFAAEFVSFTAGLYTLSLKTGALIWLSICLYNASSHPSAKDAETKSARAKMNDNLLIIF